MIRRRLTATIVALVAVIGGVVAVVFLTTLESRLTAAVDRELERVPATVTRATAARLERRARPVSARGRTPGKAGCPVRRSPDPGTSD